MPPHDPQVRLRHRLEYVREAIGLMRDKKRADLDTDRTLGLATLRCLEIVGEAASHIPESLRQQHPRFPGRRLSARATIWSTATTRWTTTSSGAP
jgi:uncharacterized protein with HEPN domain